MNWSSNFCNPLLCNIRRLSKSLSESRNQALFVQLIKSQRQTAPHCSRYRYSYLYMNAARCSVYTVHLERLRQTVEQKVFSVTFHFSHIFFFANWSERNTFKTELNGASLTKMFKARLKTHPGESEVCVSVCVKLDNKNYGQLSS